MQMCSWYKSFLLLCIRLHIMWPCKKSPPTVTVRPTITIKRMLLLNWQCICVQLQMRNLLKSLKEIMYLSKRQYTGKGLLNTQSMVNFYLILLLIADFT